MNLYKKILGCLAGLALGDALGCPTEFMTRTQIRAESGWVDGLIQAPAWHPHHLLQAGRVTDDTGQTLAVAHAVQEDGSLSAEEVARQLILWAEEAGNAVDLVIGPSTRTAIERIREGESPRQTGDKGTTNGSTYRGIIPGLVYHSCPEQILSSVVEACLPTHGTTAAISGAASVAFAVAFALNLMPPLEEILTAAKYGAVAGRERGKWMWTTPLEKRIELAIRLVKENPEPENALTALSDFVGTDMQVSESVASAFGVVALAQGDPMKAVRYGANIGGDTDTIAALAGAVCGAWQGIDAFDPGMVAKVEEVNHLDLANEARRIARIIEKRSME